MKIKNYFVQIIAVLAFTVSAVAQTPNYASVTLTGDTNLTVTGAGSAIVLNSVIDCRKQQNVALQASFKTASTTAQGLIVVVAGSVDGVKYDTNAWTPFLFTANVVAASNETVRVTNFNSYGYGYYKVLHVTNTGASSTLTNVMLSYSQKKSAP